MAGRYRLSRPRTSGAAQELFFHLSKAEFDRQVSRLSEAAGSTTDAEMRAGLARLVASVGDLHTSIQAFDSSKSFGLGFFEYPTESIAVRRGWNWRRRCRRR